MATLVSALMQSGSVERKNKKTNGLLAGVEVQLLHSLEHNPALLGRLQCELEQRGISHRTASLDQAPKGVSPGAYVVALLDGEKGFLLDSQCPIRAAFSNPDFLSSLYFRHYKELLSPIPSNYIDVKVAAVGLNWKDLAISSGRFDAENLSSEYTGIVTPVGIDAASSFCVGDRVYGMRPGHSGNYTRVLVAFAQELDAQDDLVEVATVPLVYMIAVYAFDYITRLREGHKVLIQSATEKAILEVKLLESHVTAIASGDGASALDKKLACMTPQGRGFDIILSTARGDALYATIQALAPLCHLIDVGRTDVQESKALGMELFSKSANFSSFDLSHAPNADSAYTAANAFQDSFARYRQRLGMPATSISSEFVKGIGELGQVSITVDMFARKKGLTLSEGELLARLEPAFLNDGLTINGDNGNGDN
ncbi:hypothetical protein F4814DRAFT_453418 [Daldinia grandis]|nr:hypothetical protein F4814DRAFT_453418 [Daldinia grandis]